MHEYIIRLALFIICKKCMMFIFFNNLMQGVLHEADAFLPVSVLVAEVEFETVAG